MKGDFWLATNLKPETEERNKARWMLVLIAFLWSTSGILIKTIPWGPMSIAGGRSLVAAVVIILLSRRLPRFSFSLNQICGAFAYAGTVVFFVIATKMTTAANAVLLQYTAPIYTALFGGWLLKEKARRFDLVIV